MAQNYIVTLTNGDSTSLYDIYYDNLSVSNYCILTIGGSNAVNITYSNLTSGVGVTVPDSASQIIVVTLSQCKTVLTIPITPYTPPFVPTNLCLNFESEDNTLFGDVPPWTFEPNGTSNGKNKWSYTGTTTNTVYNMLWNITAQQWEIFVNSQYTFFNSTTSEPPIGNWRSTNQRVNNITTTNGSCSASAPKIIDLITRDTNCKGVTPCTGSVVIFAQGGTPPYQYAITSTPGNPGSITWSNSNIISNICEGTINCVVKDSTGQISQAQQGTILFNEIPKTYNATIRKLRQITTIDQQSPTRKVEGYSEWVFELDQPLDTGVSLKFKLVINDQNIIHKPFGDGNYSTQTTVVKNNINLVPSQTQSTISIDADNFCVGGTQETTITGNTYDIIYQNGDVITGTTNCSLEITAFATDPIGCSTIYDGSAIAVIIPDAATPTIGCQCCSLLADKASSLIQLTTN